MIKDAIGIIDLGVEGFEIADKLSKNLKHERIIYINDLQYDSYLNITEEEVQEIVRRNIALLLKENIKLLIIVNDLIIDRATSVLLDLKIPSVNIIETLVNYTNTKYEQKNILLLAKEEILRANLYQKNIKYNRLYNYSSDELEILVKDGFVKTSKSFYLIRDKFKALFKKDIDLIIASSPSLIKLKTEFNEYLNFKEITDLGQILLDRILNENLTKINSRGRGCFFVYSTLSKKEFRKRVEIDSKFKYFKIILKE